MRGLKGQRIDQLDKAIQSQKKVNKKEAQEELLEISDHLCDLFHDSSQNCYASFINEGHREYWKLDSEGFRKWISYQYMKKTGRAPSENALKQALFDTLGKSPDSRQGKRCPPESCLV